MEQMALALEQIVPQTATQPMSSEASTTSSAETPKPVYDEKWAGEFLERNGWLKSVAGDHDFAIACSAVSRIVNEPRLGILLMGGVGVGKTALATILYRLVGGDKIRIDCSDNEAVDDLVPECDASMNGGVYNSAVDSLLKGAVYLDDLGAEAIRSSFSNVLNRTGNFIVKYHARGKGRIFITTNLSSTELNAKYGSRVLDRIADMCLVVKFTGSSKRARNIVK